MRKLSFFAQFVLFMAGLLLSACQPTATPEAGSVTAATRTPLPSASATSPPTQTRTPSPSPTPTQTPSPVVHAVRLGDDMYSIAFLYGISPQQLMTANPDVNPRAMTVGTELLIPITPTPPEAAPTPTPTVALSPTPTPRYRSLQPPDCYPDALGGMWCFALVEAPEDAALENVSAVFTLGEGDQARQETAITPLNLLPAGASLPLVAYFQPPVAIAAPVSVAVDFLLPVLPDDQRYLQIEMTDQVVELGEADRVAYVSGTLRLPADQPDAEVVWVSLTAFDAAGYIVAVRRWESVDGMKAGSALSFESTLYSMGGAIDRVDLVAEAPAVAGED